MKSTTVRRYATYIAAMALGCMGMAGVASGAGANDRVYFPTIDPASVAPGVTQAYILSVENYSQNLCQTCTPLHFIQHIEIAVPSGFILVTPPGSAGPVSTDPNWHVVSIATGKLPGSNVTAQIITVETKLSTDATLVVGKSVNITINAKYTGTISGCQSSVSPDWQMFVNQVVGGGGNGNIYTLAPGALYPKVTVASSDCLTQTNVALALVTSNNNQTIRTTDTSATVTLTATLTRADTNAVIVGEPITFTLGAALPSCSGLLTNGAGVATCTFAPQHSPFPIGTAGLTAGTYDFRATFAGDTVPSPDLGGSTSDLKQLAVNADGTGLAVPDVTGAFGGTVTLTAHLTATSGNVVGKTITFTLNGVAAGSAVTDGSGIATVTGVSTTGIDAGPHDNAIKASFAGDSTYGAVDGLGNLTLSQIAASAISLSNLSQTYTGGPLSPTVTTNPANLAYNWAGSAPRTNVGSYSVTATITDTNYTGSATDTFIIAPKTLTATIVAANKVYDTNTSAPITGCTPVGVAAVDAGNVTCTATGTFASPNVGPWTVTATSVTLGGSAAGNYQVLVMPTTSASITPAPSSVTMTGGSFPYNGAAHAATGLASTTAGSLTLPATVTIAYSGSCSVAPTTVAEGASCTATGTYAGDANHTGSSNTASVTITQAGSSVTVTGGSFVYTGGSHAATGSASTTFGSLTNPTSVTITYSGTCSSAPTTVAEGVSCTATGTYLGDANHTGSSNTASVTIIPAGSYVTVTGGSFTFDNTAHAATGLAGTAAGSLTLPATVTITYGGSCSSAPTTVAEGTTCLATGTYSGDANHTGSFNTASVTITGAAQTITFTSMIVTATATSGGTVTFSNDSPAVCQVTPNAPVDPNPNHLFTATVTLLTDGTWAGCKVRANQDGANSSYQPAPQATGILGTPGQ